MCFLLAALLTIMLGLFVHWHGAFLGAEGQDMLGDALWGTMMAWWLGAFLPYVRLPLRAVVAYAICTAVEVSQLLHLPWLDALRGNRLGHLVLGHDFAARDLVAYALGVLVAVLLERQMTRRRSF